MAQREPAYHYDESQSSAAEETSVKKAEENTSDGSRDIRWKDTETKVGSVFTIILVSALAAALLGTVMYSFDRRNTMYNKVASLKTELELAQAENVRLQSELESKMSAKNVEDYAENTLGMQKIDSSQIKYIEIQTDDVVNIPQQDEGILAKVRNFFDRCVEYFRG